MAEKRKKNADYRQECDLDDRVSKYQENKARLRTHWNVGLCFQQSLIHSFLYFRWSITFSDVEDFASSTIFHYHFEWMITGSEPHFMTRRIQRNIVMEMKLFKTNRCTRRSTVSFLSADADTVSFKTRQLDCWLHPCLYSMYIMYISFQVTPSGLFCFL